MLPNPLIPSGTVASRSGRELIVAILDNTCDVSSLWLVYYDITRLQSALVHCLEPVIGLLITYLLPTSEAGHHTLFEANSGGLN